MNENVRISIKISLKFVPKGLINSIPVLVQIMAWRRPGDKPLSEPMMVNLLTHICVTRPQWVNSVYIEQYAFADTTHRYHQVPLYVISNLQKKQKNMYYVLNCRHGEHKSVVFIPSIACIVGWQFFIQYPRMKARPVNCAYCGKSGLQILLEVFTCVYPSLNEILLLFVLNTTRSITWYESAQARQR